MQTDIGNIEPANIVEAHFGHRPGSPAVRNAFRTGMELGREITEQRKPIVEGQEVRQLLTDAEWIFVGFFIGALSMLALVMAAG